MSDQYLFSCDCGEKIPVSTGDAGKTLSCPACSSDVVLPGFRDLKKLPPAKESKSSDSSSDSNWSREKGILYAVGVGMFVIGLIVAGIFYNIGATKFNTQGPKIRGGWTEVSEAMPEGLGNIWAYAPEPGPDRPHYQPTGWDAEKQLWVFYNSDETRPKEYFTKWGDSAETAVRSSLQNATVQDMWKFWYETEPQKPLPEWVEPVYVINTRFAYTFYAFASVFAGIALIGMVMVIFAIGRNVVR